jgi:hypothetical protein
MPGRHNKATARDDYPTASRLGIIKHPLAPRTREALAAWPPSGLFRACKVAPKVAALSRGRSAVWLMSNMRRRMHTTADVFIDGPAGF